LTWTGNANPLCGVARREEQERFILKKAIVETLKALDLAFSRPSWLSPTRRPRKQ
jgi:hypothetical protein